VSNRCLAALFGAASSQLEIATVTALELTHLSSEFPLAEFATRALLQLCDVSRFFAGLTRTLGACFFFRQAATTASVGARQLAAFASLQLRAASNFSRTISSARSGAASRSLRSSGCF